MSCGWCGYSLRNVYPNWNGYDIFDESGRTLGYSMCSLNCGVAQIYKLSKSVDLRVEYLRDYYCITQTIIPAKDKMKLSINGGQLAYAQFRQGFICPAPEYEENDDYFQEEEDYEFCDDPYRD